MVDKWGFFWLHVTLKEDFFSLPAESHWCLFIVTTYLEFKQDLVERGSFTHHGCSFCNDLCKFVVPGVQLMCYWSAVSTRIHLSSFQYFTYPTWLHWTYVALKRYFGKNCSRYCYFKQYLCFLQLSRKVSPATKFINPMSINFTRQRKSS